MDTANGGHLLDSHPEVRGEPSQVGGRPLKFGNGRPVAREPAVCADATFPGSGWRGRQVPISFWEYLHLLGPPWRHPFLLPVQTGQQGQSRAPGDRLSGSPLHWA